MTKLLMTKIDVPSWARPFAIDIDTEFEGRVYQAAQSQMGDIQESAHRLIQRYLDEVSADTPFPEKARMTGDYYISEQRYGLSASSVRQEASEHRLGLFARCLEHPFAQLQTDFDYLGLEVYFLWNEESGKFEATDDIDSSSI